MAHKEGDIDEVIDGMIKDHKESKNPESRINRQKYVDQGHPKNEVRRAAETVSKILPTLEKYGRIFEGEKENRQLKEAYRSLEERVGKDQGEKQEKEALQKRISEMEKENGETLDIYRKGVEELKQTKEELKRIRDERGVLSNAEITEEWNRTEEMEIRRLNIELISRNESIHQLDRKLEEKNRIIGEREQKIKILQDLLGTISNVQSASLAMSYRRRRTFMRALSIAAGMLGLIVLVLLGRSEISSMASVIRREAGSSIAAIFYYIHVAGNSMKLVATLFVHDIGVHIRLFDSSLISPLRSAAILFLILLLIFLIISVSKR